MDMQVTAKFAADITDMAAKMNALKAQLNGVGEEASKTSKTISERMSSAGDSMVKTGKKMSLAVTAPLVGIGIAATKTAMDFDDSMAKIVGLVGLSAEEVNSMRESVLALSGSTAKAPQELADALFVVTSAGLKGEAAISALEQSAKASAAGLGLTSDIARAVAGSINAYGAANLDAARATDVIVATARAGNFETSQFAAAIGRVLPFAKQAGASLEEMGGAVALLTRTNGDAAQSVTQVAALFRTFVVPTQQATDILAEMGMTAGDLRKSISEQGLAGTLKNLDERLGGNREQLGRLLGSSEAASAAFQILESDSASLEATFGVVADSVGMTGEAFDAAASTSGFQFKQAMTDIQTSLIQIGDIIAPVVASIAESFASLTKIFGGLPKPLQTAIVIFGVAAAALGPILVIGGKIMLMLVAFGAKWTAASARVAVATTGIRASVTAMEIKIKTAMISATTQTGAMLAAVKVLGTGAVSSFRRIGVAAKGLMASFGPIGIALIGVTVAMEVFSGASAEADAIAGELTGTVDALTGSFNDAGHAAIAFKIRQSMSEEDIAALEAYGITVQDMTTAVTAGGQELAIMQEKLSGFRNLEFSPFGRFSAGNIIAQYSAVATGADMARKAAADQAAAAKDAGFSNDVLGNSLTGLTGDMVGAAGAAVQLEKEVADLNDLFIGFDQNVAAIRAKNNLSGFLRDIADELPKTNRNLLGTGAAAHAMQTTILDAFEKAKADAVAWGEANNATTAQVAARFQSNAEKIKRTLVDEGFKADDLETFFGKDYVDIAGVSVEGEMATAIGTMADRLGAVALREFKGVGADIAKGTAAGVAAQYTTVENETRLMIARAEAAARQAAQSKSPSKLLGNLGKDLVAGLIEGISEGEENIKKAARTIFVDWYKETRGELLTNLNDAKSLFSDFVTDIQKNLLSGIDLGAAFNAQFDEEGKRTGTTLVEAFNAQIAQAEWFGNVLKELKRQGVSDQFIQQIASMGPAAGGALGQQLLDDGLALTMSSKYDSVIAAMQTVGEALVPTSILNGVSNAQAMYTGFTNEWGAGGKSREQFLALWDKNGVDSAQATYEGLRKNLGKGGPAREAIMNLMDRLAAAMNRTAEIVVTTKHVSVFESVKLPGKAMGGPVSARSAYIVGEKGPEVFVPGNMGNIIPNNMLGGASSANVPFSRGSGGSVTNVSINVSAGMGTDGAEVGRQIVEQIKRFERTNGPVFVSV